MIYKVSVLKGTKATPELVKVTEVLADRFATVGTGDGLFGHSSGIAFYNDQPNWYGKVETSLIAFLPGTEWIIERA